MKLYVLRATYKETYDCPDNGLTDICERYEDIGFSTAPEGLAEVAADLNRGHDGKYWSEERANALRKLDPNYGEYNGACYAVYDVSNLFNPPKTDT